MTIVPYTAITATSSRVVSDKIGIVKFVDGAWSVVEEGVEEGEDTVLLSDFVSGQFADYSFLLFSSIDPPLLSAIDLPLVSSLTDLLDVNISAVTDFQYLVFVGNAFKNGVFYNGFDFKLGSGPFQSQYIGRFSIHIGSLPGLKSQLGVETLAMGHECGSAQDGFHCQAIGYRACFAGSQLNNSVATGSQCAYFGQDDFAIAVGYKACYDARQAARSIAFGSETGGYGTSSVCIGSKTRSVYKNAIVLSASDEPFEAQTEDSFYINPQNVPYALLTDKDDGGVYLAYSSSSGIVSRFVVYIYKKYTPAVDTVNNTPVTVSRVSTGEYLVAIDNTLSFSPYDLIMLSTAIDDRRNISIVHKQNGNNFTIYVARDGEPRDDVVFEFVLGQPSIPALRAVIGGPSVLLQLDTYFSKLF